MGRPRKDVRAKRDARSGRFMVMFHEVGRWTMTPADTEKEALAWARRNRGRIVSTTESVSSLKVYATGFYLPSSPWAIKQRAKGRKFSDITLRNRQGHVDNYLIPLLGQHEAAHLTAAQIEDAILNVKSQEGRDLAPATKYKIIDSLRIILDDMVVRGVISRNPIENLVPYSKATVAPRGAIPREAFPLLFPPTHAELVKVWTCSMWAAMMCLLRDTGMRPGEARALRWSEIFPDERILPIRHGVASGTSDTIKTTKNDMVKAGILSIRTVQELAVWRKESRFNKPGDYLFTSRGKIPVSNEAVVKAFRRGLANAGFGGINWTPYWLRHSFITYNMDALDDSELLMLAGHTNIATNTTYRHPDDEIIRARARPLVDKVNKK